MGIGVIVAAVVAAVGFLILQNNDDDAEGDEAAAETTTAEADAAAEGFVIVEDSTGRLTVEVPETWSDVDGRPLSNPDAGEIPNVQASVDLSEFRSNIATSGVSYSLIPNTQEVDQALDFLVRQVGYDTLCTDAGRVDYDDGEFVGRLQRMENCGNVGTTAVFVVASPADSQDLSVEINYQLAADAAPEIGDRILATFRVDQ
jgi:hypothetical protein